MNEIINVIVALLSVVSCLLVWRLYKLTRVGGLLFFFLAVLWGMLIRIAIVVSFFIPRWDFVPSSPAAIAGFWVFFPIGMYALLKNIERFYKK